MCGLRLTVDGGRVTDIRGDEQDPLSRGAICPKAVALRDLHEDPDRLRKPLKKTDRGHVEVTWREAFDEVANRLCEIRRTHGQSAVATYFGNPMAHNTAGIVYGIVFTRALNIRNKFSATSLDQLPQMLAAYSMLGHQLLLPIPDLDRTQLAIIIGANPAVSNGSLMTAPGVKSRLRKIRKRGGRVVVIDPRRTETAQLADEHHFIRPGTDALWLFALARTLFEEVGPRLGRLGPITKNLNRARALAQPFTPEAVAEATGVAAEVTRQLARELAETPKAILYGRLGVCTQAFGGLCGWLLNLINLLAGNLDHIGGAMFTTPAIDTLQVASYLGRTGSFGRRSTRVRDLPEFGGEMPTATLAEEIETEGEDQIRALVTAAGNPVLSAPNGGRLDEAFRKLDFMVSIDPYLNETTRHADYILPPVSPLERDHYDLVFHTLAVRNTAKFSPAPLEAPDGTKQDWEIFLALTHRIESRLGRRMQSQFRRLVMGGLGPRRLLDLGLRFGPHQLSLRRVSASRSGMDLGPLEPRFPGRLFTPDKKIDAAPELFAQDVGRLRAELDRSHQPHDLLLIGRRELRSNNSWMHNAPTLMKGHDRCTLRMHPTDAESRGLREGEAVRLRSEVAAIEVPLQVSDELMPGVVSLPHGYGHNRDGTRNAIAIQHAGASVNDILDDQAVDALTGNAVLNGQRVWVEAL